MLATQRNSCSSRRQANPATPISAQGWAATAACSYSHSTTLRVLWSSTSADQWLAQQLSLQAASAQHRQPSHLLGAQPTPAGVAFAAATACCRTRVAPSAGASSVLVRALYPYARQVTASTHQSFSSSCSLQDQGLRTNRCSSRRPYEQRASQHTGLGGGLSNSSRQRPT